MSVPFWFFYESSCRFNLAEDHMQDACPTVGHAESLADSHISIQEVRNTDIPPALRFITASFRMRVNLSMNPYESISSRNRRYCSFSDSGQDPGHSY